LVKKSIVNDKCYVPILQLIQYMFAKTAIIPVRGTIGNSFVFFQRSDFFKVIPTTRIYCVLKVQEIDLVYCGWYTSI